MWAYLFPLFFALCDSQLDNNNGGDDDDRCNNNKNNNNLIFIFSKICRL